MNARYRPTRLKNAVSDCCPTCGAKLKDIKFWVDIVNNIAIVDNQAAHITPQCAVFLHTLRKAYPHAVPVDRLISAIWGSISEMTDANLRVLATHARRSIDAFNTKWRITCTYDVGYRLIKR